jgi:hypothetical protein
LEDILWWEKRLKKTHSGVQIPAKEKKRNREEHKNKLFLLYAVAVTSSILT